MKGATAEHFTLRHGDLIASMPQGWCDAAPLESPLEVELHRVNPVRLQFLPESVDPIARLGQQRDQAQLAMDGFHVVTPT
jgi:hypothetical protein